MESTRSPFVVLSVMGRKATAHTYSSREIAFYICMEEESTPFPMDPEYIYKSTDDGGFHHGQAPLESMRDKWMITAHGGHRK